MVTRAVRCHHRQPTGLGRPSRAGRHRRHPVQYLSIQYPPLKSSSVTYICIVDRLFALIPAVRGTEFRQGGRCIALPSDRARHCTAHTMGGSLPGWVAAVGPGNCRVSSVISQPVASSILLPGPSAGRWDKPRWLPSRGMYVYLTNHSTLVA